MKKFVVILVFCLIGIMSFGQKLVELNGHYIFSDDNYIVCDTTLNSYLYITHRFNITYNLGDTVFKENESESSYNIDKNVYKDRVVNVRKTQEYLYSFKYRTNDFYTSKVNNASKSTLEFYKKHNVILKLDSILTDKYTYNYEILPSINKRDNISLSVLKTYKNVLTIDTVSIDTIIRDNYMSLYSNDTIIHIEKPTKYIKVFRNGRYITSYNINDTIPKTLDYNNGMTLLKTNPIIKYENYLITKSLLTESAYGYYNILSVAGINKSNKLIKKVTYKVNFYNNINEFKFSKEFTVTGYTSKGEMIGADFNIFENNISKCKIAGVKVYYNDNSISTKFKESSTVVDECNDWNNKNIIKINSKVF